MDKETKENAIKKMEKMDQVIAYPDELLNRDELDEYYKGKYNIYFSYFSNLIYNFYCITS